MRADATTCAFTLATRDLVTAREELDAALARLAALDGLAYAQLAAHAFDVRHGRLNMNPDGSGLREAARRARTLKATVLAAVQRKVQ